MKTFSILIGIAMFALASSTASAGPRQVGVVVRDETAVGWSGALVMRDIMQKPEIVGLLPEGTEVYVLDHLSNNTYRYVTADGLRGWVKRAYIRMLPDRKRARRGAGAHKPVVFADIPADHWARAAVERLVTAGLISKHTDRFKGAKPVTRYELAVVLDRTQARTARSLASIEDRLRALEHGEGVAPTDSSRFRHLVSMAHTLRKLEAQNEELRGRLDALEPEGSMHLARRLHQIEHRLDVIERSIGSV